MDTNKKGPNLIAILLIAAIGMSVVIAFYMWMQSYSKSKKDKKKKKKKKKKKEDGDDEDSMPADDTVSEEIREEKEGEKEEEEEKEEEKEEKEEEITEKEENTDSQVGETPGDASIQVPEGMLYGRYIILQSDIHSGRYLNIAEIEVFDHNGDNISIGKEVSGSTLLYMEYPFSNLVDGDYNNFTSTQEKSGEWLSIDLGDNMIISKIVIYNSDSLFVNPGTPKLIPKIVSRNNNRLAGIIESRIIVENSEKQDVFISKQISIPNRIYTYVSPFQNDMRSIEEQRSTDSSFVDIK